MVGKLQHWKEGTDFGQSRFGHPDLTDFGQSNFEQSILGSGVCHGGSPKGGGPKGGGPEGWGPKFRSFFFSFPATVFFYSPSLVSLSWNFGGV